MCICLVYRGVCLPGIHLQPLYWLDRLRYIFPLGSEGLVKGWRGVPPGLGEEGRAQPFLKATLSCQARGHALVPLTQVVIQATEGGFAWAPSSPRALGARTLGTQLGPSQGAPLGNPSLRSLCSPWLPPRGDCQPQQPQPPACFLPQAVVPAPVLLLCCQGHPPMLLCLAGHHSHVGV